MNGAEYSYEDLVSQKKKRDDEYRQLIFDYLKEKYGSDTMKIGHEQGKFYDIGRAKKMFED